MTSEPPELIWLRPERSARGPAPTHSRAAIAAAAIASADAEGLAGVSMRKIAAALGAGTMSLYNYVPKKEQLFDLMLDAVAGEVELPGAPSGDPRADLKDFARRHLAAMRRHPWVPGLLLTRTTIGPNSLRHVEYFLAVVADLDESGAAKMELFAMLNSSVSLFAQWEANQRATGGTERWQAEIAAYLGAAVAGGGFPHLAAAFASGPGVGVDEDSLFERGLERTVSSILNSQRNA